MRVAIAHDYLTQRGGAERVVLSMLRAFPHARLITAAYDPARTYPEFRRFDVECLWLNKVPAFKSDPRRALPVLAAAFSHFELAGVDVVLCSSSGWSHGIRTSAPKIVYCHNPARWLYQTKQYSTGLPRPQAALLRGIAPGLRRWDRAAASTATTYLANSTVVAERVLDVYGRRARILHPATNLDPGGEMLPVPGVEPGYLLSVGRPRGYKNTDAIIQAVAALPEERLVLVGHDAATSARVTALTAVPDAQLRWLYANAAALIAVSYEDFGLTPIEAFGFGTPVIALGEGGYLDTMLPGRTGILIEAATPERIVRAVRELRARNWDARAIAAHGAKFNHDAFVRQLRDIVQDVFAPRIVDLTRASETVSPKV